MAYSWGDNYDLIDDNNLLT